MISPKQTLRRSRRSPRSSFRRPPAPRVASARWRNLLHGWPTTRKPPIAATGTATPAQFAALDQAARDQGAASFVAAALAVRRTIVESALNTPQPVTRLPTRPTGANLVADFMGMYFSSAEATDLCYQAEIGRDTCRGLEGSEQPPKAMAR